MPEYNIYYMDHSGALSYKFSATCDNDKCARIVAHAMKLLDCKRLEVWNGESIVYQHPQNSSVVAQPPEDWCR